MTKQQQLIETLANGKAVTEYRAKRDLKIKNLRAEIARIREKGYKVETINRLAANHRKVTEYRMTTA